MANAGLLAAQAALKVAGFDAAKHPRGAGGKFGSAGGGAKKQGGSVAAAHALFDKMKGKPKADVLAAAQALGINANTAKTQLYHWQKKQALAALGNNAAPTKAELQAAAAKALGVKQVAAAIKVDAVGKKVSQGDPMDSADSKADILKKIEPLTVTKHPNGNTYFALNNKLVLHELKGHGAGNFTAVHSSSEVTNNVINKNIFSLDSNGKVKSVISGDTVEGVKSTGTSSPTPAPKPPGAAPKPAQPTVDKPDLAKLGPTKYVHALADHMKGAEKKAVIAAATAAGVNKSTAGVQYGKWAAKQAGEKPQLAKSPEPKPLQAKQPQDMSDKELDKAIDSYQGKVDAPNPTNAHAPTPYNHLQTYHDSEGGKALTAKMAKGDVYTNKLQGKTFYKSHTGSVYEHVGPAGVMTKVAGDSPIEMHYDPATKIVHGKGPDGSLVPIKNNATPVFKNNQPHDATNHALKDDKWAAGVNGVQDPNYKLDHGLDELKKVHANAGVTYDGATEGITEYTGSGYEGINDLLRDQKDAYTGKPSHKYDHATRYINQIDDVISKSSFKADTIMWRGVGQGGTVWNGAPPPQQVVDHGFTSVSFNPQVGKGFSDGKTLFRVKVPAGFPGINVAIGQPSGGGVEGLHGEAEVILPRGTTYKVVARTKDAASPLYAGSKMDVVDLEPVLPAWYVKKYGQPKLLAKES